MSDVWRLNCWREHIDTAKNANHCGLRMHYESGIHPEVYLSISRFAKWLRKNYVFPLRVNVYVKKDRRIKANDGELVVGTIWRPLSYDKFPYIRLATGDYPELVQELGEDGAVLAILHTFAHELTHYFQHINNIKLTTIGEERQATTYANYIISDYSKEHRGRFYVLTNAAQGTVCVNPNKKLR